MRIDGYLIKLSDIPGKVAVSPSGHHVYVTCAGRGGSIRSKFRGTVAVVDPFKRVEVARIRVGRGPSAIAVEPSGEHIFVANRLSGDVSVVDAGSLAETSRLPVGRDPVDVAGNADRLYVANHRPCTISVIDKRTMRVVETVATGGPPGTIVLSPDGGRLYVRLGADEAVSAVDTRTLAVIATATVGGAPADMVLDRSGRWLYVANTLGQTISVVDTVTVETVRTIRLSTLSRRDGVGLFRDPVSPQPWAVGVTADGSRLLVAFWEAGTVAFVDAGSGAHLAEAQLDDARYSIGPYRIAADWTNGRFYVACADHALASVREFR